MTAPLSCQLDYANFKAAASDALLCSDHNPKNNTNDCFLRKALDRGSGKQIKSS